jgi:hypothetical protein
MEYESENNRSYKEEIQENKSRHREYFGMFTDWHYPKAAFRIMVLVRDPIDKDKMLLIYNNESNTNKGMTRGSQLDNAVFREDDQFKATSMQEIIKCHIVKQMASRQISNFKQNMLDSLTADILDRVTLYLENQKRSEKKLTGNLSLMESFKYYDRMQAEDMLHRWRHKSSQLAKEKSLML